MASTSGTRFWVPTADLRSELAEAGYTQVGLRVSYCELWTADEKFYRAASPVAWSVHWIGEPAALG